jgi:hypothetical protein
MPLSQGVVCVRKIKSIINSDLPTWVFVESVFLRPYQGLKGTITMLSNYGRLLAALEDLQMPYEVIPPNTWQTHFGIRSTATETTKTQAISICRNLYPDCNLLPHDGIADAALIGTYGFTKAHERITP